MINEHGEAWHFDSLGEAENAYQRLCEENRKLRAFALAADDLLNKWKYESSNSEFPDEYRDAMRNCAGQLKALRP